MVILDGPKPTGCSFGDPLAAWSVDRVHLGRKELAILHAKTWAAMREDFPWPKEALSLREVSLSMFGPEPWTGRVDDPAAKPAVPEYPIDRDRFIRATKTLWAKSKEKLRCIVCRDSHIGNTFITPAGEPVRYDGAGQ